MDTGLHVSVHVYTFWRTVHDHVTFQLVDLLLQVASE